MAALQSAFTVLQVRTEGKSILLFDDLYRSGATVSTITGLLGNEGKAKAVYLLTLTQTSWVQKRPTISPFASAAEMIT